MGSSATEAFTALQEILFEFRAGKMLVEGKCVAPDSRKGLVRIGRGEEGLIHFQWLDRSNNSIEDLSLFEPRVDNDTELCSSVNFYINQPLEFPGEEEPDSSVPLQNFEDMLDDDISSRAGNLVGPSMGAEVISDVSSSGPVKLADLQRILSNIGSADEAGDPDGGLGLGDILKPELLLPLMESLSLEQGLASHLPEGQWTTEDVMELLQSPPFRQQVDSFTYVLRTGQIDLTQFGVDPSKYKFTVLSFLEALEDSVAKTSNSEESRRDDKDLRSQTCNQNDPMDEGQ